MTRPLALVPTRRRSVRLATALIAAALALTACSSDGDDGAASVATTAPASTASASAGTATADPGGSASRAAVPPGATSVPAPGTTTSGIPSNTSPTPAATAPQGAQAKQQAAAPGAYTLDTTGTFTSDVGGEQPVDSESTLQVDPASGDDQHSTLSGDQGSTEQTVRFTASQIQLVQLKITSPAFVKEWRPVTPVQLLPQPPKVGSTWRWTIVSTDGATTAALDAKVARTETLTIGGEKVVCTLVQSTLTLSGDIEAVSTMDTWVADRYQLTVKEHAVTKGTVQAVSFTSDTTSVLRSTKPS